MVGKRPTMTPVFLRERTIDSAASLPHIPLMTTNLSRRRPVTAAFARPR